MRVAFILALCLFGPAASAQEVPPPAYQVIAAYTGVPAKVLYAVSLQESGRSIDGRLRPWPWALNIKGRSHYFDTHDAACVRLTKTLKNTSAKRVDVGIAQINVGYHGKRVGKPCDLLNPYVNLLVAATILTEQHKPKQDWLVTMGKYHSPANGEAAARYRTKVQKHWLRLQDKTDSGASQ